MAGEGLNEILIPAAAAIVGTGVTSAAPWVASRVRKAVSDYKLAQQAKTLLGMRRGEGIAYRHDSVHTLLSPSAIHPDNRDAVRFAAGSDIARAKRLDKLTIDDDITVALQQNIVLLGSPASEGLSRILFGYQSAADNRLILHGRPIELPFVWQLDQEKVCGAKATRYVRDIGLITRPNWHIVGQNRQQFIPEVDENGLLASDYLLITRIRNYLTPAACDMGRFIVSIGGAHGTATRAIGLLLRNRDCLTQVAQRIGVDAHSFQLIFRVDQMVHDPAKGTYAKRITLVDAVSLPDNAQIWSTAHSAIKNELLQLRSIGSHNSP